MDITQLPLEVALNILEHLSYRDASRLCRSDTKHREWCKENGIMEEMDKRYQKLEKLAAKLVSVYLSKLNSKVMFERQKGYTVTIEHVQKQKLKNVPITVKWTQPYGPPFATDDANVQHFMNKAKIDMQGDAYGRWTLRLNAYEVGEDYDEYRVIQDYYDAYTVPKATATLLTKFMMHLLKLGYDLALLEHGTTTVFEAPKQQANACIECGYSGPDLKCEEGNASQIFCSKQCQTVFYE